jgi:hypothetical protein
MVVVKADMQSLLWLVRDIIISEPGEVWGSYSTVDTTPISPDFEERH